MLFRVLVRHLSRTHVHTKPFRIIHSQTKVKFIFPFFNTVSEPIMADNQAINNKRGRSPRKVRRKIYLNNQNKRNQRNKTQFLNSLPLPTSNKFSALGDSDNAMDTSDQQQHAPKKTIISPIVVTDHKTDIQEVFKDLNLDFNLHLTSVGRKILPKSAEDKTKIIEILINKNVNFYTHPENDSKTFKVILSGLPQVETTHIEESLKEHKLTPTKITMFNTQAERKLYLLHFNAAEVNKKTLDAIKYVYHHKITWLPYKPKRNGPTQCLKCLWYGHGIKSCNRYTVCMLCAEPHLTTACPTHNNTNTNRNTEFKCFNCMSAKLPHNHKANDANCPFRLKYEQAKNNARTKTTTNQRSNANTTRFAPAPQPPPLRVSFADSTRTTTTTSAAASTSTSNRQSYAHTNARQYNTSTHSIPSGNLNANTNPSSNLWTFDECANILFDSIERLQNCTTKFDQLKVIAELLKHACK